MPKYIIRLDDACPTMDKEKWGLFEKYLDELHIKPIVAVIPNNQDEKMIIDRFDDRFWDKVHSWQDKGWHIALHGYDHRYITKGSGLVPLNNKSEFVGLTLEEQKEKIRKGWGIFQREGILSDIWVAPSHTFDENTLKALKEETSISIVSDGMAFKPFSKYGFLWIPQQLWRFRKVYFGGIYTICYHPNTMRIDDIHKEFEILKQNSHLLESCIEAFRDKYRNRTISLFDLIFEKIFFLRRNLIRHYVKRRKK